MISNLLNCLALAALTAAADTTTNGNATFSLSTITSIYVTTVPAAATGGFNVAVPVPGTGLVAVEIPITSSTESEHVKTSDSQSGGQVTTSIPTSGDNASTSTSVLTTTSASTTAGDSTATGALRTSNSASPSYPKVPQSTEEANRDMKAFLDNGLSDSNMRLLTEPWLTSELVNHDQHFCAINAADTSSGDVGTSFPRCLLNVAVNRFCHRTTSQVLRRNDTFGGANYGPHWSDRKVGLWSTYRFTGYSISALYIGIEIVNDTQCLNHTVTIKSNADTNNGNYGPDAQCYNTLMTVVDACKFQSPSALFFSTIFGTDLDKYWFV
jgi:hypothetical protein